MRISHEAIYQALYIQDGLLRQYFPKGTDLGLHPSDEPAIPARFKVGMSVILNCVGRFLDTL